MSKSAAEPRAASSSGVRSRRRFRGLLAALVVAGASWASVLPAQAGGGPSATFELTRTTQHSLHRLQESWAQWVSSFYQDHPGKADEALKALTANARQLGMSHLVDFSLGAAALALQSGREGKFERATWAMAAAETLDPDRPEIAFARAALARQRGAYFEATRATGSGFVRLLRVTEGTAFIAALCFWLLAVLAIAAALFVLVEVAMKGSAVVADLQRALTRRMSPASAALCSAVALFWPLALPAGFFWLLLYWSALLWAYCGTSERWTLAAVWLVVGLAPWVAAAQQNRVAITLSPPMRALANFSEGRLYGGLFGDLQVLKAAIGGEVAVQELLADVHRTLGQWEEARLIYRKVLESEPENVPVLLNLGAYHFRKADFAVANDYFLRATKVEPAPAGAFYDLSLSYSETYQFEESRKALAEAKEIDADQVDRWIRTPNSDRILAFNGGLARAGEIRRRLVDAWAEAPSGSPSGPRSLDPKTGLAASALAAAVGVGLYFLRRRKGVGQPVSWLPWRSNAISRWLRALFPLLSQAELGEGGKAAASAVALVAVVMLPRLFSVGIGVPIAFGMPNATGWVLFGFGLVLYIGACVLSDLREGE